MQRMDSLDSPKNKVVFKKRSHRPWNPTLQNNIGEFSTVVLQAPPEQTSPTLNTNVMPTHIEPNRLFIGGFPFEKTLTNINGSEKFQHSPPIIDVLKNKDKEIEILSNNLKIANALEHVEKMELFKQQEALARKVAEEKSLFAMQQVNLTEEQLQQVRQQLQTEQILKKKEESIRKSLEIEIKNAFCAIERNENELVQEMERRRGAEEKIEQIQLETAQKIADAEAKVRLYKQSHVESKQYIQQTKEELEQIKTQKNTMEENLASAIQDAATQKAQHELETNNLRLKIQQCNEKIFTLSKSNATLKEQASKTVLQLHLAQQSKAHTNEKIESLQTQIQQLTERATAFEAEKAALKNLLVESDKKSVSLQSIIDNERRLRIISEEKSGGILFKKMEESKKFLEKQIIELTEKLGSVVSEKTNLAEKYQDALELSRKNEILAANEAVAKKTLEEKNKNLTKELCDLETSKKQETHNKETAEYKLSILAREKQYFEQERELLETKYHKTFALSKEFEVALSTEKRATEILKKTMATGTEQQEALAQEKTNLESKINKISLDLNEFKTALNNEKNARSNLEETIKVLLTKKRVLETERDTLQRSSEALKRTVAISTKQKEIFTQEKVSLEEKIKILSSKKQNIQTEKDALQEKYNKIVSKSTSLEKMLESEQLLRKETEHLKSVEEQTRKMTQEKIKELEVALGAEKRAAETLKKTIDIATQQQESLTQEKINLENKTNKTSSDLNELKTALNNEKNARSNLEETMKVLLTQKRTLETEKDTLQHTSEKLKKIFTQEKTTLEEKIKITSSEKQNLQMELEVLQEKHNKIVSKSKSLEKMLGWI
jgi:hypothetical protein